MRTLTYGFGINTVLAGEEATKYASATECAKMAVAEGFGFIMAYTQHGDKKVIAWNARVVSKEEALAHYMCDGDKRAILNASKAKIWIITPVKGFSDILIPFEGRIRSFQKVALETLV